jgi:hypothetical protein
VALRVLCCPEAKGFSEDGGERESCDLPEPDAGEQEADAEGEESKEGAEQHCVRGQGSFGERLIFSLT